MKFLNYIAVCVALVVAVGCGQGKKSSSELSLDTLYVPKYASGFEILNVGSSSVIKIKNPWQGAQNVEMQMFLSRNGEDAPKGFEGITVCAPLKRVVCMSSSYIAFIDAIGCVDAVKGVSGARFITNEAVREAHACGEVKDVGYDTNLNYELIAALKVDVVMIYGVAGENSSLSSKLGELGINVIYIGDYIEQSPLGKAEWIVAMGEMFDQRDKAQQLFEQVEKEYNALCQKVKDVDERPSVMINAPWRDTWFVPGDRSYMVRLINDAGGVYACRGEDSQVSRPISGESAFVLASSSDVWLNPNQATSIKDVVALNPNFKNIPPVRSGRVYNNTRRNTPDGGSDFWESGAVYPNIVLRDLIAILHPQLADSTQLYYYKQLN